MSWFDGIAHRLRRLMRPGEFRRDLDDEIGFHLDLEAQQHGDARRFGNRTYYKEETRRMTWLGRFDPLRQDLSYAWRSIARSPGFTAMVVVTLALGLGATAALFSLVDKLFLRQPPGVQDPATLRRIWIQYVDREDGVPYFAESMSYRRYAAIARALSDSSSIAVFFTDNALRQGTRHSSPRLRGVYASDSYFGVLGLRPALGRFFAADENKFGQRTLVTVISHAFWQERLHGDSGAIGDTIQIGRDPHVIIGVLPPGFAGLDLQASDVWLPVASMAYPDWVRKPWWEAENLQWYRAVMRVPVNFVAADFERRASQHLREFTKSEKTMRPDTGRKVQLSRIVEARGPGKPGQEQIISTRLSAVAGIVLLIACANVINLLLSRAVSRRRETAVRLTLGISRRRLLRLFALESTFLSLIAAGGAILVGWWGGTLVRALLIPEVEWRESVLHWRVIVFTIGVSLLAGLVAGLVPALQASDPSLTHDLKHGVRAGIQRSRLRTALIVTQAALSVLLLTGAGLFVRSLLNVRGLDIGYDSGRLVYGEVLFEDGKALPLPVWDEKMRGVADELTREPGIETVARAAMIPMLGYSVSELYFQNGATALLGNPQPMISAVSPSFFRTVGIRMLRGRAFGDDAAAPHAEVVVNEKMAALLWPGREPLGECLRFDKSPRSECYTVVGIAENVNALRVIESEAQAQYYVPLGKVPGDWIGSTVVVRARPQMTSAASAALRREIRRAFPTEDPSVTLMTEALEPQYRPWRLGATLFTAFGILALLVAIVGIYSSVSYSVSQRTHEFGVHMALGARVSDVLQHVVRGGVRNVVWGVLIGVALSIASGRLIVSLLYNVAPYDPAVLVFVSILLVAAAAIAAMVPAWRAARVDPVSALKTE